MADKSNQLKKIQHLHYHLLKHLSSRNNKSVERVPLPPPLYSAAAANSSCTKPSPSPSSSFKQSSPPYSGPKPSVGTAPPASFSDFYNKVYSEPHGFGFVKFHGAEDATEAKEHSRSPLPPRRSSRYSRSASPATHSSKYSRSPSPARHSSPSHLHQPGAVQRILSPSLIRHDSVNSPSPSPANHDSRNSTSPSPAKG
ncbi:flocculation protein FLO11-like isoform X2 [Papaver somniferum]|uniref:flocculation protein FLO11-like isoform X2 n=1 Tax=Papaver somniferum TaxID=3469 RepID=UPI000E6FBA25|nr:flocculation protein FLO11-like isoform X2 [Papaver somniferum]